MQDSYEIYPNAPAALVAAEARHSTAAPLTAEQEARIKAAIAEVFPLSQPLPTSAVVLPFGLTTQPAATLPSPRFTNRERTAAVTFGPEAIVVETTKHESFSALSDRVALVAKARQEIAPVDSLERLGLRYVDEIRVPDSDPIDWSQWIDAALLGPATIAAPLGLRLLEHQAVARFELSENHGLTIAYGPRHGYAVAPAPLARVPVPPLSTFFLVDMDSYWTPSGTVPEFDPEHLVNLCNELHTPVNALFEKLITERLRTEVLRHA